MSTANRCRCLCLKSRSRMRSVSKYCFLLILGLVFVVDSRFIQSASAQDEGPPSGTLVLVGPEKDPFPDDEFEVKVEIVNPQNVIAFTIEIEYPDVLAFSPSNAIEPGEGQFEIQQLSVGPEVPEGEGRDRRELVLNNTDLNLISAGTLLTIKFTTSEIGNHQIAIRGDTETTALNSIGVVEPIADNELPSIIVPVRGPMRAAVNLVKSLADVRVDEASFIDIELSDRRRAHSYEITIVPSANLGALTVSYNADDSNSTAITNHTPGAPITIRADLWRPNDPFIIGEDGNALTDEEIAALTYEQIESARRDENDWLVTYTDPIVASLFFTPTAGGEGSLEITAAKIFDTDGTALTLSNPDTLTFTIAEAKRRNVTYRNTGIGPTPTIEVEDGVKNGPFEILIHFKSENYIEQELRRLENGEVVELIATFLFQRGVYGFARDEIIVGGDAGASVTTRIWETNGAVNYYARINPTETGAREVTLQVPAGVVNEVGTNLPNVASEIVTVSTNLTTPPWDVDNNGRVQLTDAILVEEALGQGLGPYVKCEFDPEAVENDSTKSGFECGDKVDEHGNPVDEVVIAATENIYANTIENPRTDVNGDLYVNQVDVDLVRAHISDEGGAVGSGDVTGQTENPRQARSIAPPPDASVWMPDENLRKEVRKKFGIRNDSDLTQALMTHLISIGFRNDQISDITGLEYAINLTELVFRNTQISDLEPLRGLASLESLKLVDNNITDITALGGLTGLTLLNISGNNISDLTALGNLTHLTELWATDNNIGDVTALASLTQLQKLRLRDNPILDTSPLYPLTQGALQDVDIPISQYPPASTWMPDANLRKVVRKALSIGTNENFSREEVATLTGLTAEKKRIGDLTGLEHATNLRKLNLKRNRIVDVGSLEGLTELTELTIGYNNISDVTAFTGLTELSNLGLSNNEIGDISALGGLTKLKELWLRDNNVSDITSLGHLTQLTHLSLEENEVRDITALADLTKLKAIWLRENNISDITALGSLTQLTYLDARENEISDVSVLGSLTKLKELRLHFNNISDIAALGSLTQLTYLNLNDNEIGDITALGSLTKLTELWLRKNSISDVSPLSSLRKLKQLGLRDNPVLDTSPLYPLTRRALKKVDITVSQYPPWDVNEDGSVDATDSALVTAALGQTGNAIVNPRTDVNGDDSVDQEDLTLVTDNIDTDGGAPPSVSIFALMDPETLENLDRSVLERYLNTLHAENDGSLKYERAIAILERILAMTRPKQTQLLANYPNPFNPETWIPYQLANASDVKIVIYDVRGTVVRRLDLGHQREGYYTSRSRAAYWDGSNTFGESVASGIYFYQLQADNVSSLRKLLIIK